jgi:hypothetical protein
MDHQEAIRLTATERYLMDELSPELRDQFEEHFFDCAECASDVKTASLFIETSKDVLAEPRLEAVPPFRVPVRASEGWFAWLRPALAVPTFAVLLAVIGYQNFLTVPRLKVALNSPQVLPSTTINTRTRGAVASKLSMPNGSGFGLTLTIPPDPRYSRYIANLYSPSGEKEWSLEIPIKADEDTSVIRVPPRSREPGIYSVTLTGVTPAGQSADISRTPLELQIEK